MFSMWIRLSGVSRVTSTSRRRSLSITSAQRWMRLRAAPEAIAPSVDPEHGAIRAAGASDEPEANGAVRSLSPSTVTAPGPAAKRSTNEATTRPGSSGGRGPASRISWLMTWAPASLTHRPTSQPAPVSARSAPPA